MESAGTKISPFVCEEQPSSQSHYHFFLCCFSMVGLAIKRRRCAPGFSSRLHWATLVTLRLKTSLHNGGRYFWKISAILLITNMDLFIFALSPPQLLIDLCLLSPWHFFPPHIDLGDPSLSIWRFLPPLIFARKEKKRLFWVCLGFGSFPDCVGGRVRDIWQVFVNGFQPCDSLWLGQKGVGGGSTGGIRKWLYMARLGWKIFSAWPFRSQEEAFFWPKNNKGVSSLILPPTPSSFHCETYPSLPFGA